LANERKSTTSAIGYSINLLVVTSAESYVSHHPTSKHQGTRLGSRPNLNSQASSPKRGMKASISNSKTED